MRTYGPFVVTGILSIGITLLISYWFSKTTLQKPIPTNNQTGLIEAARKGKASVVFIIATTSDTATYIDARQTGSGVIISEDGYIVTNHHVIASGNKYHVQLEDKREYEAQLAGIDSSNDIALLRINETRLPFLEFGDSDSLREGEPVLAVGNPYRLSSTVTSGIVSAKERDIRLPGVETKNFIQTDVPINLGNSGGALLNASGKLMGLNIAMMSVSGQYEGFSFALPSNLVKKITDDLREFGSNQKGSIGMSIRSVNEEVAKESGMTEIYGVVVESLKPGGAADVAGIQSLDIILSVNGSKVQSNTDMLSKLALYRAGEVLSMGILRNGKADTIEVVLQKVKVE